MPATRKPQPLKRIVKTLYVSKLFSSFIEARQLSQRTKNIGYVLRTIDRERRLLKRLPTAVSSEIIDEVCSLAAAVGLCKEMEHVYPASLYILQVSGSEQLKQLKVHCFNLYSCEHRDELLTYIHSTCKGIERLEFGFWEWYWYDNIVSCTINEVPWTVAMGSLSNLKHLIVPYVCSNDMLFAVGESCHQLESLDVSRSGKVTDIGVAWCLNVDMHIALEAFRKSKPNSFGHRYCFHGDSDTYCFKKGYACVPDEKFKCICRRLLVASPLTRTLKQLNLMSTGVSCVGASLVLRHVRDLQTFRCSEMTAGLELLEQQWTAFGDNEDAPTGLYRVTCAESILENDQQVDLLQKACPLLRKFSVALRYMFPSCLSGLSNVRWLLLSSRSPLDKTVDDLYTYAQQSGYRLRELLLHFSSDLVHVDVSIIANSCPNLQKLAVIFMSVTWKTDEKSKTILKPIRPLVHLRDLQLGETVSSDAILNMLTLSPHVERVHIYACYDKSLLSKLNETRLPPDLKCFFVCNGFVHYHPKDIVQFLKLNLNVQSLGSFTDVFTPNDREMCIQKLGINIDIQFADNLHWSSNCIVCKIVDDS